jgi:hypothetical protein
MRGTPVHGHVHNAHTHAHTQALLDTPLVDFKIRLLCRWSDGEFEDLDEGAEAMEE